MSSPGARRLAARLLPDAAHFREWVRPLAQFIEGGARFGYVARGAVYFSIGVMALMAALKLTPRAEGPMGALRAWGGWWPGLVLLWVTGVGLLAFAGWRALQAVFDADRVGASPKGLMKRTGKAASGLVGLGLGLGVFGLLAALEDSRELDDQAEIQAAVEKALALPGGDILLMAVGAGLIVAGLANAGRAFTAHFTEELNCNVNQARWVGVLARTGSVAKGAALVAVGVLTAFAGWQAQASSARGLGGALEALKGQPLGHALLAVFAAGFMAYGAYAFLKAGLRRIGC